MQVGPFWDWHEAEAEEKCRARAVRRPVKWLKRMLRCFCQESAVGRACRQDADSWETSHDDAYDEKRCQTIVQIVPGDPLDRSVELRALEPAAAQVLHALLFSFHAAGSS